MNKVIVYKISFKSSNKTYIGCSKEYKRRCYIHLNDAKTDHNSELSKAIRKYGEHDLTFTILCSYDTKEEALEEERRITHEIGLTNLYNMVYGGGRWGEDYRELDFIKLYAIWKSDGIEKLFSCKPYEMYGRLKDLFRQGYGTKEDLVMLLEERENQKRVEKSKALVERHRVKREAKFKLLYTIWKNKGILELTNYTGYQCKIGRRYQELYTYIFKWKMASKEDLAQLRLERLKYDLMGLNIKL